jgi:hypothetical protein
MSIGDMVRRMVDDREPRNPDGGINGLTPAEEDALDDLLNGQNRVCPCLRCQRKDPIIQKRIGNG